MDGSLEHLNPAAPPRASSSRRFIWLAVVAITIIGAGIRVWPIAERPLWFDEAATWDAAVHPSFAQMWQWKHHFLHPPLSFALVRAICLALGSDAEWVLRLPALLAGILCIPVAYALGGALVDRRLGLLAACLVAVDPCMVDQSQQARMYGLFCLFAMIALVLLVRAFRRDKQATPARIALNTIVLGLVLGLMTASHLLGLVVWAALGAALVVIAVLERRQTDGPCARRVLLQFIGAAAIAVLLNYHGMLRIVSGGTHGPAESESPSHTPDLVQGFHDAAVTLKDMIHLTPAGLGFYLLAAVGGWLLLRRNRDGALLVAAPAVLSVTSLIYLSGKHFIAPRYLVPMLPALWLGLAAVAVLPKNKGLRALGATCLAFYLVLQTWQVLHIERWWMQPDRYLIAHEIQYVRDHAQPGEAITYHPQVMEVLGRYYHLPADPTAETDLYNGNKLKKDAQLPPTFDAPSAAVIVGMVNYDERIKTARRLLDTIAQHYEATIDSADLDRQLQLERVLSATFTNGSVQLHSRGLTDDSPP